MGLIDEIEKIGKRMKEERSSLEEDIKLNSVVHVSDEDVDYVDRLIYNHCLNKKSLYELFGSSKLTFNERLNQAEVKGIINKPILQNRSHLYNRFDIQNLMDYWNFPKYSDSFEPNVITCENHKGGSGKSTTIITLAVATALDLKLNAKCCVIDLDPQGTVGRNLIRSSEGNDIYLTMVDSLLSVVENDSDYSKYLDAGHHEREIIFAATFSTHLPNLDVIPSFPNDDRFTCVFYELNKKQKTDLISRFREKVIPVLKQKYDFIFIDTPSQDSPILWSASEAADCIVIPITLHEFDFISTTNYMLTVSERLNQLPSEGRNLKWIKILPVNVNSRSSHERKTLDKLTRSSRDKLFTAYIMHSEAFVAAASLNRSVLDLKKSEGYCSSKQFDIASTSVHAVYKQFINEIKMSSERKKSN
ncbi:chromosomal partitioning protein [Candidatus Photodesmus blepharus]|uniref:Chromosomal partitioning protein n=1 Tax=Candidatus Photodesmus blepharonis TaxID=1179155 RepID=A0A084CND5_9GAMM|nr:ParA family protein [Candidatus Photodesmus blepharus]KEY91314.1 chromosomal partitioning protein [Candidatus Photodesmus blepharus]